MPSGGCSSSPCRNGGQCLSLLNSSFVCLCQSKLNSYFRIVIFIIHYSILLAGFFGLNCETSSCSPNPCKNNQECFFSGKPNCLCILLRFNFTYNKFLFKKNIYIFKAHQGTLERIAKLHYKNQIYF